MTDRILRGLIGLVALGVALTQQAQLPLGWVIVLYVVAAIGIITGIAGWCPLYAVVGIGTCPAAQRRA